MVAKRSLANWRLLSSVVIGALLASTIMSGTVIYFDSLRDLALDSALENRDPNDLDILAKTNKGPTNPREAAAVRRAMEAEYERSVGWMLQGVVGGVRSATFFMTPPGEEDRAGTDNARAYFLSIDGIEDRISLLPGGRMPEPLLDAAPTGEPLFIEAAIPQEAAEELGLVVGDTLSAIPHWLDATSFASVVVSGVYSRDDPDDPAWRLNDTTFHTFTSGNFRAVPCLVSEATLLRGIGGAFPDMDSSYGWLLDVDHERLRAVNAADARLGVGGMNRNLSATFLSYRQITQLDAALAVYDERLLFTRLQMFVVLFFIAGVALYYVVTLSSLVAEQRRDEISLLHGRGATEGQIMAVFAMEGATIAIAAVALAPPLAALCISLLGYAPAFGDLSGGGALPVTLTRGAFAMSALGGALSFGALMLPAFEAARSSISRDRERASRPSRLSFFQKYYIDALLLLLGIVLFRQLSDQGSVAARNLLGEVAVNQLLLAAPAVTLIAAAIALLRLFPLAMALASRLLSPHIGAGLAVGLWQMARNPTHYARLALLLILMSGLGIFAASFGGTLERSFEERARYAAGADVRLTNVSRPARGATMPLAEPYERMPEISAASPALRAIGSMSGLRSGDPTFDALAVDTERFADVGWYREDFSSLPLADVVERVRVADIPLGIPLPDDARAIDALLKPDKPHPTAVAHARLRDANGRYFTYPLGALESGTWRSYSAELYERSRFRFGPVPSRPLTLVAIAVSETNIESGLAPGSLLIDSIRARRSNGDLVSLEDFRDVDGWNALEEIPTAARDRLRASEISMRGDGSLMFAWDGGPALIARGVWHGSPPSPLPVAVSASFLRRFGHAEGDELQVSIGGRRLTIEPVETVDFFPTLDSIEDRFVVADLDALRARANLGMTRGEVYANEMWLRTDAEGEERALLLERLRDGRPFRVGRAIDTEEELARAKIDPLVLAGWRALLLIAFGSILALSGLGFLVHAYISFRNRELQFALMRTMGFSTRQLVSLMWLEQALVIAVGMALGTWLGGRLGATIMPFLGHDDRGSQVLPPFVIEVGWQNLLWTYLAMAAIFTAIVLGVIWFIRRMSLSRALRLGDG